MNMLQSTVVSWGSSKNKRFVRSLLAIVTLSCNPPSDLTNQKYYITREWCGGWQARAGVGTLDLKVAGIEASMLENEIGIK